MRTNGNLAVKPAYKPAYQPKQTALKKKSTAVASPVKKSKKVNLIVAIFYLVIIFAVALCLVSREVHLYEKSTEISRLQNELELAQAESKQAMVAAEKAVDLESIEETATTQYGMVRPEKNQTIYVNIEQSDYVEKVAQKDWGSEIGQAVRDGIKNIFGIFGAF